MLGKQPASEGVLQDAEFVIKKERKVLLSTAPRLFERAPTFVPKINPNKPLGPTSIDLSPEFDMLPFKTRLLRAKPDMTARRYGNYLRGGYGTIMYMPFLEGYFASQHHTRYVYGLQVRHLSVGQATYAEEVHNLVQLHGKLFTKLLRFGSEITYNNDKCALYNAGQSTAMTLPSQTSHQVAIRNTLANYVDATLNYQIHADFHYVCHTDQARERQWEINGKGDYAFNDVLKLKAFTDLYFAQYRDTKAIQRNLWRFKPTLALRYNQFHIEGGANIVYQNDASSALNPFVYPVLAVKYARYRWLQPYAGVGGDIQRNDLRSFLQENPLLASTVALRHTNQRFVLYGGVRGSIKERVVWRVGLSTSGYQDFYCLVNSDQDPRRFEVKYDTAARLCNLFCEFNHTSRSEALSVRVRGDSFYYYKLQELTKPWHRPRYQLDLLGTYRLNDKLAFKCTMHWIGGITAWDTTKKTPIAIEDVLDTGLGIDYWLHTRFYAFCNLHNLLDKKNERYLHYPSRGFHLMAGISYTW